MTEGSRIQPPEDTPPVSAEHLIDGVEAWDEFDEPRRYPSTIGGLLFLIMLGIAGGGLLIVAFVDWRLGLRVISGALIGTALCRANLRSQDAGMLAVRSKLQDVTVLVAVGSALLALAQTIPDQPG